jgi:hypothetical protein
VVGWAVAGGYSIGDGGRVCVVLCFVGLLLFDLRIVWQISPARVARVSTRKGLSVLVGLQFLLHSDSESDLAEVKCCACVLHVSRSDNMPGQYIRPS